MIKVIIGLIFSLGGLYLAFKDINLIALGNVFSNASVGWIILAVVLMILSVWIRAVRWQALMDPIKKVPIKELYSATMIGYFGNSVLPMRLGEILRAYALGKSDPSVSRAAVFGTIVIERFVDMIGALVLMVLFFLLYDVPQVLKQGGVILAGIVVAFILILWWLVKNHEDWIKKYEEASDFQEGAWGQLRQIFNSFIQGLIALSTVQKKGAVIAISALLWGIYLVITYLSGLAVHETLTWIEAGVILIGTTMVIAVPSAPGYIGTYHASAIFILVQVFNREIAGAQAYALLNHAVGFIPLVVVGAYFFLSSSIKINDLSRLKIESIE
ncbi:MAG: lysylphosphatidylglycerol synthase transmembrane domain-containing protein [Fidelibacterota bacterium]